MPRRHRQPPDDAAAADADADAPISKSERKRDAHRLQTLGRRLTELKPADLNAMPIDDRLRQAIADYQRFPSHGAQRRQLQFIGRLMRDVDPEPLQAALETLEGHSAEARYELHMTERWRERLLTEPEALTEFLDAHPEADAQLLRQRIADVHKAGDESRQRAASRALFRFLRDAAHPV